MRWPAPRTTGSAISARRRQTACSSPRYCRCRTWTLRSRKCSGSRAFRRSAPCLFGRFCRRPLPEPSPLRAAMGRARAARDHGGGPRHTRPVEPRMDLAWAVLREDQGPAGTAGGPWRGWRTVCRGGGREQHHLHPGNTARPSAGADPRPLARQLHVRRFDPDRFHGHGTLSGIEDRCRARQGLLDAGSTRKRWRPRPG